MKQAFDLTSIRLTLRRMVEKGYLRIEDLDRPSNHFQRNTAVDRRIFPGGYVGIQYRNPLRDDPEFTHPETVEAGPSLRDFAPVEPPAPKPEVEF